MTTLVFTSSGTWTAPAGVTSVDAACWGESGNAANGVNGSHSGGGAGAGGFSEETSLAVTPGSVYSFTIGAGGTGTATSFPGDSVTVTANAGASATTVNGASGGAASGNTIAFAGGHGGNGASGSNKGGGGGGGSGGSGSAGGTGGTGTTVGGSGGSAGTGANPGAAGAAGGGPTSAGGNGNVPGGAPGGGGNNGNRSGGNAVSGQVQLTYSAPASGTATLSGVGTLTSEGDLAGTATLAGVGTLTAARAGAGNATLPGAGTLTANATQRAGATLSGAGTLTASGGLPVPAAVNQWAATFAQPAAFGTTPPALQSVVVPLTLAYSTGGGSGTPTAGNWLFCITVMNEQATASGFTVAVGDDIHSFWRPGDETTSTWAVSTPAALTRTSIWYTPNIARVPQDVYVAPGGAFDAIAVLVVEISGLGPWDTVTGISTNYAAAATTLNLALGAPAAAAFTIAAIGGDNTANGQAFAPGGWTALSAVTSSNGVDHTCDADLTAAFLPSTTGSVSVNGTASSAVDLSGAMIQVLVAAPSPVPASQNPNWPLMKFEAALGGGFQTPPDKLTWTDLTSRLWSWDETTGIQYQLGQIQATDLLLELDNFDAFLSYDNASSPYYQHVVTGTPIRIRAALGTIGGVTVNRWYVIQRNFQELPQQITGEDYRRWSPATGTDIWSVLSASGPSPYRGEVEQDAPYAWWPMDDQPLAGGVQPTSLRNAASGNTNVLAIQPNPGGITAGDQYTSDGIDATAANTVPDAAPQVAVYSVGQQAGWMYGDPQSGPQSSGTGNPVTASPGSAAWQQAGGAGNAGNNAWFLTCNDASFPGLSGGITFSLWFSAAFLGTASGWKDIIPNSYHSLAGQPYSVITLAELATASAPVMILQLDISGHLNLITYNGGTGTSHAVYSGSDLRNGQFSQVTVTATTSAWTVYVNGGLTAQASGSGAGMTSAWTWLVINADLGSAGGSSLSSAQHSGNVAYSHAEVFPRVLPAWRVLGRYCAAVTAFGLLPAPQALSLTAVCNQFGTAYTADGTEFKGSYGTTGAAVTTYTFSGLAVAQAGSYTSGPSSRAVIAGLGQNFSGTFDGNAVFVSFTALAPSVLVYTAASANNETNASAVLGSGDSFTSGFGASASGHGTAHTAGGTGAAYPASASALGDSAGQRLERILGYGGATYPGRCIDPAALPVQAATDIGGQQTGQNLASIAQSDGGLLYVDNQGNLTYWQKSHLASQYSSPVWTLTPAAPPTAGAPLTAIPYYPDGFSWTADPHRVWNAVLIQPFSPDGASLADVTPSSASSVSTSQAQFGPQPRAITSYLQATSEMQSQADWIMSNFGTLQIRVEGVRADAAPYPAAWIFVLGASIGDVLTIQNWQIGGGGITGTFRISNIQRRIKFAGRDGQVEGSIVIQADFEPSSYWS